MKNAQITKDKKLINICFKESQLKAQIDELSALLKDVSKERKNYIIEKFDIELINSNFTLINGFTNEVLGVQSIQNRTKLNESEICADLGVPALTVENGYKFVNPVACYSIGKITIKGFK